MPMIFQDILLAITRDTRKTCNQEKNSKKNTVAHYRSGRLTNLQYIISPKGFISSKIRMKKSMIQSGVLCEMIVIPNSAFRPNFD
jgi:hypothetical protein